VDVDGVRIGRQRNVPLEAVVNDADAGERRNPTTDGDADVQRGCDEERIARQQNGSRTAAVSGADFRGRGVSVDNSEGAESCNSGVDESMPSSEVAESSPLHACQEANPTLRIRRGAKQDDMGSSTSEDTSSSWSTIEEQTDVNDGDADVMTNVRAVDAEAADPTVVYQQGDLSLEVLAAEQRHDTDIRVIVEMLEASVQKPSWDDVASRSSTTKALWQQWPRLLVRDGVLYRRFEQLDGRSARLQLVIPFKLRRHMFCAVHEGVTGGHMGRRRTELQLQSRAYWPGWTSDVRRFLKMCDPCAQYHRGGPPKLATLKPFFAGDVFETVSIDVTGPHPRSRHGNVYMLTIMDHFSK